MKLSIALDPAWTMDWHLAVRDDLGRLPGVDAPTLHAVHGPPLPASLRLLLDLERILGRGRRAPAARPATPAVPPTADPPRAGLVVDLTGSFSGPGPVLALGCDGAPLLTGAVGALTVGATPRLEMTYRTGDAASRLGCWPIAVEDRTSLTGGLDGIFGRARQLVRLAVRDLLAGRAPSLPAGDPDAAPTARRPAPVAFAAGALRAKIASRLARLAGTAPDWRVAWRRSDAAGLPDPGGSAFQVLPDDGRRFYADPVVRRWEGRTVLLVEEFPYATGRGLISAVEFGPDGPLGPPRPVLEEPCHLSYPHLLEHGGVLHMIPETSARRTVELWRCVAWPDRFEQVAVLVEGADLSDATVFRAAGCWHMLANGRDPWCSSWDALEHYVAPDLHGPWTRRGDGPVAVDVRRVRPGGAPFLVGGRLVRPVQDSTRGYGSALAFVSVDFDGDGALVEQRLGRLDPPAPYAGLHSFDRSAGLEVIDLFGPRGAGPVNLGSRSIGD